MVSPENTKGIIVKQETYDSLVSMRDVINGILTKRGCHRKASIDDVITLLIESTDVTRGSRYMDNLVWLTYSRIKGRSVHELQMELDSMWAEFEKAGLVPSQGEGMVKLCPASE